MGLLVPGGKVELPVNDVGVVSLVPSEKPGSVDPAGKSDVLGPGIGNVVLVTNGVVLLLFSVGGKLLDVTTGGLGVPYTPGVGNGILPVGPSVPPSVPVENPSFSISTKCFINIFVMSTKLFTLLIKKKKFRIL